MKLLFLSSRPSTDTGKAGLTWTLLSWLIPTRYKQDLLDDLLEEYRARRLPGLGREGAGRWLRKEARRALWTNLRFRVAGAMRVFPRSTPPLRAPRAPRSPLGSVSQDLAFAIRSLLRSPSFAIVAILTLALGVGANTAIFSVLDGVMFKPLPFVEANRLVLPWETFQPREILTGTVSYPNLQEWKERNRVFEDVAGLHPEPYTLTGRGLPERLQGVRVTANFLPLLGIRPDQGRLFLPEDDQEGAPDVAMVTQGFWVRHFGDSPLAGTETLILNERPHTIVGVLPKGFDFPLGPVSGAEVWTPAALDFVSFYHREWPRLLPLARLKDEATLAQAQADMERVAGELADAYPETNRDHGANVVPLMRQIPSRVSGQLIILLGAVGLILFVACMNVAGLLLARGMDRQRELGIRSALGAGRLRMIRQLVTEGLLLSALGGVSGLALAWLGTGFLVGLLPESYPRVAEIGVDLRTLAFAVAVSILTCLLAALFPAIQAAGRDVHQNLKEGGKGCISRKQLRVRRVLVTAEVALAVVVLVGAGLLIRSFQRMNAVDPGFEPQGLLTFRVAKGWSQMQVDDRATFYTEAVDEIAALPGVLAAGAGSVLPVDGRFSATFQHDGQAELPRSERPLTQYVSVTPTYFDALGIPLLRGEGFTRSYLRDGPGVIVINEAAAAAFWPDENPVGRFIRPDVDITEADPVLFEVVGVVGNVRDRGLDQEPSPTMYVPHTQQTWPTMSIAVRTDLEAAALVPRIREVIDRLSQEASFSFREMEEIMARTTEERRFLTLVMGFFGGLALLLAAVGVFGVLSYSVAQRTREVGLRRALGADHAGVYGLVTRESLILLLVGGGVGLAVSFSATRLVRSFLFGVEATDLMTYLTTVALLLMAGLVSSWLPARRATKIDPMVALKME